MRLTAVLWRPFRARRSRVGRFPRVETLGCAFLTLRAADHAKQMQVPGNNATLMSRPVGYGVIRAGVRAGADSKIGVTKFPIRRPKTLTLSVGLATPNHTIPYGTVLWRDAFPGTSCLATIMLSLRDKGHFAHRAGPRHTCSFREVAGVQENLGARAKTLSQPGTKRLDQQSVPLCLAPKLPAHAPEYRTHKYS